MSVAQKLYEQGIITYMRTDSTNLSKTALDSIKDLVVNSYGSSFLLKELTKLKQRELKKLMRQYAQQISILLILIMIMIKISYID